MSFKVLRLAKPRSQTRSVASDAKADSLVESLTSVDSALPSGVEEGSDSGSDTEVVRTNGGHGLWGLQMLMRTSCTVHGMFVRQTVWHKGSAPQPDPLPSPLPKVLQSLIPNPEARWQRSYNQGSSK